MVKCPYLLPSFRTYGHLTVNYKIEQYCPCHLRTYLTINLSLVITDICPCTEFVNYVRSEFITQATGIHVPLN